jgi:hypothetical protein
MRPCCQVIVILCGMLYFSVGEDSVKMYNRVENQINDDVGELTSCNSSIKFHLTWTPRIFRTGQNYLINATVQSVATFNHGDLCVYVWLDDLPNPIYQQCGDQQCTDAQQFVKKYLPLPCPIPGDSRLPPITVKNHKFYMDPSIPIIAGNFKIKVELKNENNQQILCAEGNVQAEDDE